MPHQPQYSRMDPRLAERVSRKEAQLDHYRSLPSDTAGVRHNPHMNAVEIGGNKS